MRLSKHPSNMYHMQLKYTICNQSMPKIWSNFPKFQSKFRTSLRATSVLPVPLVARGVALQVSEAEIGADRESIAMLRRPIKTYMPERRLVLLGVLRGGRDPSHARVNARLQDHITKRLPKPGLPCLPTIPQMSLKVECLPEVCRDGPNVHSFF